MNKDEFKDRTKEFALRCIDLALALPDSDLGRVVRRQLLRCGTSVGANYRSAARAKSAADFVSKMGTVEEETDECLFWMEVAMAKGLAAEERCSGLYSEGNEILSMVIASIKTARRNAEVQTRSTVREEVPDWNTGLVEAHAEGAR